MKGQFTFIAVPGTTGTLSQYGDEIVVSGPEDSLVAMEKLLTVKDKKAVWALNNAKKRLAYFQTKNQNDLQVVSKITSILAEIEEYKAQQTKEYWARTAEGKLSIPPGFWAACENIKDDAHLNTEVKKIEIPTVEGKSPRDYQHEIVEEMMKYKRASGVIPTGSGKSMVAVMLALSFVKCGKRVLIVEPTIELVRQTKEYFDKYHNNVSGLGGSYKFKLGNDILISTINSASKHIDIYDVVIVDEMQHSAAATYEDTSFLAIKAKYFYGLTACPIRADGLTLGIHAACGPVVYMKNAKWGVDNKFLTPPKICMVEVNTGKKYPDHINAQQAYSGMMKNARTQDAIYSILKKSIDKGKKTLIIFKTVQAGMEFKKYCKGKALDFDVASSEFRKPLHDFKSNKINFLVANSGLLAEGVDVPNIECVISCVQNSSENLTRQILGRGLRLAENKEYLSFFDVVTKGFKQFEGSAHARRKIYKELGNITELTF